MRVRWPRRRGRDRGWSLEKLPRGTRMGLSGIEVDVGPGVDERKSGYEVLVAEGIGPRQIEMARSVEQYGAVVDPASIGIRVIARDGRPKSGRNPQHRKAPTL